MPHRHILIIDRPRFTPRPYTWVEDLDLLQVPVSSQPPSSLADEDVCEGPHVDGLGLEAICHVALKVVGVGVKLDGGCVVLLEGKGQRRTGGGKG